MTKESILYKKLDNKAVQCQTCCHYCLLKLGEQGRCQMRVNENGRLVVLNYGQTTGIAIDPIEKKPLYHFLPDSYTLSFGTLGCNFQCQHCQNFFYSQVAKDDEKMKVFQAQKIEVVTPEQIVAVAMENKLPSISYTYNEPTIFLEYAFDTMKLAHKNGLKNIWVTNGFMSRETLELIAPYLDAANVDLKAYSEKFYQEICGAHLQPVLDNLIRIKKLGIHLEVTTLIIPGKNDSPEELRQVAEFIAKELGTETPWHVSAFYPTYQMTDVPPTPREKILEAEKIGREAGLQWVHGGNI
ncbi:MAG TPA: AmmeMemoRadiSam system radical SAM enzyme [Patescibacteria group bacterium]|nr:AmmeMemoRadiSam system radical SAM enzyme [Patescibacteria group bacterium]